MKTTNAFTQGVSLNLGDDTTIVSIDMDGVALGVIKAQRAIIDSQERKIAVQQTKIEQLFQDQKHELEEQETMN